MFEVSFQNLLNIYKNDYAYFNFIFPIFEKFLDGALVDQPIMFVNFP
jgi:hypothetical protein